MIAGLPPNLAALLPGFLAGCGTIAAVWWFGRSWFGPEVGLGAAAVVALNDYHIAFSATALTDVLLGLWLVLAVDAIGRSLVAGTLRVPSVAGKRDFQREAKGKRDLSRSDGTRSVPATLRWAIMAGVYTGLAWWTKYNGWLPLAIEAVALPILWLLLRPPARQFQSWLACFAVTALVAAAIWSPYFFSLQSHGGYGPIAANHSKYVVGLAGWFPSAVRQLSGQYAFGQWPTIAGVLLAALMPALLERRGWCERFFQLYWLSAAAVGVVLVSVLVTSVGAAVGLSRMLVGIHLAPKLDASWQRRTTGFALLAVWWGGMLVATPLYAPYPRLALPYLLAAALGTALNVAGFLAAAEGEFYQTRLGRFWQAAFFAAAAAALLPMAVFIQRRELPSERRGLMEVARQVRGIETSAAQRAIYVYGEPALYFQLRAAGEAFTSPIQELPQAAATLEDNPIPTFLIAGPHAHRDPQFVRQFAAARDRWELLKEFEYQPSAIVWLDLNDPRRSPKETTSLDRVRLYQLRP
jgi:4-amino-4-deoxy-L-arabinose transferase-like glycosyltransferase